MYIRSLYVEIMFKKAKEHRNHIVFYVGVSLFIGFFWVLPHLIDATPAEIVGEGLDHVTDTWRVIGSAAKIFTQGSKEIVTGIGALAGVGYAIYHFMWK